jgi:hypothetical protein
MMYTPTIFPYSNWERRVLALIISVKWKYPCWSNDYPIHFIGHSLGGIAITKLADIFHDPDVPLSKDVVDINLEVYSNLLSAKAKQQLADYENGTWRDVLNIICPDFGPGGIYSLTCVCTPFGGVIPGSGTFDIKPNEKYLHIHFGPFYLLTVILRLQAYFLNNTSSSFLHKFPLKKMLGLNSWKDIFTIKNKLVDTTGAFWEMSHVGIEKMFKTSKIYPYHYLLVGYAGHNDFPILPDLKLSIHFWLFELYYWLHGINDTDGLVPLSSQINFLNQPTIKISDVDNYEKGKLYYSLETGNHVELIFPEHPEYNQKFYDSYLMYLNKIQG